MFLIYIFFVKRIIIILFVSSVKLKKRIRRYCFVSQKKSLKVPLIC